MIDYTNEGFIIPIERDGGKGYASVNSMLFHDFEDDYLDITGNYFVYLLDPKKGSTHFTLQNTGNKIRPFIREGGAIWIDSEIVQEIINAIENRRKQKNA